MPVFLVPNSNSEDAAPVLREFNPCHEPAGSPTGGQFCSGPGTGMAGAVDLAKRAERIRSAATTSAERQYAHVMAEAEAKIEQQLADGDTFAKHFRGGMWTPERERTHVEVLERYFRDAEARKKSPLSTDLREPTIVVLAGMPGAGKSTARSQMDTRDAIVADGDAIKEYLPEWDGTNATVLQRESAYLSDLIVEIALARRMNVVVDGTLKTVGKSGAGIKDGAIGKIEAFKKAGFRTEAILIDVTLDQSIERAVTRFGESYTTTGKGRYVAPSTIRSEMVLPDGTPKPRATFDAVKDATIPGTSTLLLDAWSVYDGWSGTLRPGGRGQHRMRVRR